MKNNLIELLAHQAAVSPSRVALKDKKSSLTYSELLDSVKETAAILRHQGIGHGDRVLVFIPMSLPLYQVILSLFYLGATAVFLDAWASRKRLSEAVELADCRAFIGSSFAYYLGLTVPQIRTIPLKLQTGQLNKLSASERTPDYYPVSPDDPALITFTTGSTGKPKAANRTYDFLYRQHLALSDHLRLQEGERVLTTLPIVLLHTLAGGCTGIIAEASPRRPEKLRPQSVLRQLYTEKVETAIASPVFFEKLATHITDNKLTGVQLQTIFLGGAPVFPGLAALLQKAFPATEITVLYGSTEAEPISHVKARTIAAASTRHGLPAGKPAEKIRLQILQACDEPLSNYPEEKLAALIADTGETGEICVAGDFVLKEYYKSPEAWKENKFHWQGTVWHRTGDAGYLDQQGNLYLMGRIKQRFTSAGKTYYPFQFEQQLQADSRIRMATVMEIQKRILVVIEPVNLRHKAALSREYAAIPELPQSEIVFLRRIPRDPRHNSKIDYDRLKILLQSRHIPENPKQDVSREPDN